MLKHWPTSNRLATFKHLNQPHTGLYFHWEIGHFLMFWILTLERVKAQKHKKKIPPLKKLFSFPNNLGTTAYTDINPISSENVNVPLQHGGFILHCGSKGATVCSFCIWLSCPFFERLSILICCLSVQWRNVWEKPCSSGWREAVPSWSVSPALPRPLSSGSSRGKERGNWWGRTVCKR